KSGAKWSKANCSTSTLMRLSMHGIETSFRGGCFFRKGPLGPSSVEQGPAHSWNFANTAQFRSAVPCSRRQDDCPSRESFTLLGSTCSGGHRNLRFVILCGTQCMSHARRASNPSPFH